MTVHPSIIEGPFFQDILDQPDTLRAIQQKLEHFSIEETFLNDWQANRLTRVVLTGMGSSLHALYPLHRLLSANGIVSHWMEAAELLLGFSSFRQKDTLLIAVSQSGESAEIVTLLENAASFGFVIGVTNKLDSTLGRTAQFIIPLCAGIESTVSCKTYIATLAALHWLGAILTGSSSKAAISDIAAAETAVRNYLAKYEKHVAELIPLLNEIEDIFVTGRGDALATAGTGGLILKESTRMHAEGMSAAAFRHGPLEMADKSVLVLIFEGDENVAPLHRRLAEDIVRGGGHSALVGPATTGAHVFHLPQVPSAMRPIIEILPVQMLSLALATRGGFEAGRFERASKITNVS